LDRIQPAAIGLLDLGRANLDAKAPGFFCASAPAAPTSSSFGEARS
jgi:hypothetical protein